MNNEAINQAVLLLPAHIKLQALTVHACEVAKDDEPMGGQLIAMANKMFGFAEDPLTLTHVLNAQQEREYFVDRLEENLDEVEALEQ